MIRTEIEQWPLKAPFRITGYTFEHVNVLVVTVERDGVIGRGEGSGVYYLNDTPQTMLMQIEAIRDVMDDSVDRYLIQTLLPPGGARNALDCALWELEAKSTGVPVWKLAGLKAPRPLLTTHTVGIGAPAEMAAGAVAYTEARAIKVKLNGDGQDAERVKAIRAARPGVWMGVDANQGFTRDSLEQLLPTLVDCQISLVEQPFKVGEESLLEDFESPIPIAADESLLSLKDLPRIAPLFDTVNIKLDKCGGLTEALAIAREAKSLGLGVMVGNMVGTSLSMGPAFVLGQLCDVVDLDGPLFLTQDRTPGVVYHNGEIFCPGDVWGG
jgi:L-Ala-D/L-Glu epimerase / N-acetyl-D-glutamate racemase